jgi:hypothetical protein
VFQRFRFAESRKWFPLDLPHEADNPLRLRAVPFNPPGQIIEGRRVKFGASHIPSFSMVVSSERPSLRCAASRRRCFIVSDFRRYAVSRSEAISRQS